jgi:putative heme-binding domain-containing protein
MSRLLVFGFALALCAQSDDVRNPRTSPQDVAAGAKTFRSHCSPCHGYNGEGGRGPNLASGVFYRGGSDAELLKNISDGIPGTEMPGLFYSPDRVWQVIAYIRSLSQSRPAASGDSAAGARVFAANGCPNCHRVAGQGGRLGPDLTEIGRIRSLDHLRQAVVAPGADVRERYWVVSFKDQSGNAQSGFVMNEDTYTVQFMDLNGRLHSEAKAGLTGYKVEKISKMPSYQGKLSDAQLNDLVAYLSSLRPKGGVQ